MAMKTRKTVAKRFKISHPKHGRGKLMHSTQGINHLTGKRTARRQMRNNEPKILKETRQTSKVAKLISLKNI